QPHRPPRRWKTRSLRPPCWTASRSHDLACTAAARRETTVRLTTEHHRGPADSRSPMLVGRMQRGWANLQETLTDAERAAAAARPLVAHALAATSAGS